MTGTAGFISAVAALLWPLFGFTLLFLFYKEIRRLIGRIKRGKFFGQEIELEESLTQLEYATTAAVQEVGSLPATGAPQPLLPAASAPDSEPKILDEAIKSPRAALLLLASELEREVRQIVASLGLLRGRPFITMHQGLAILAQREALPTHVADSVQLFWNVRNQLIHGHQADDDDILRAIDLGNTILRAIKAIPHEVNVVHNPGVDIFSDKALLTKIEGAKGVILETESPDGSTKSLRIFPSTRTHFRKGMKVSWEWSPEHQFDDVWYRDPETGETKHAWSGSREFVGRDLDAL